jgi:hypothetical protein
MSIIQIGMDTDKVERDFTRAYMEKLTDRIAELEKERDYFKMSSAVNYGLYCELLFSPNEPPESLKAHNLEQQAKGVEDAKEYYSHKWVDEFEDVTVNIMKKGEGYIYPEGLGEYSSELYNQAKELKETV